MLKEPLQSKFGSNKSSSSTYDVNGELAQLKIHQSMTSFDKAIQSIFQMKPSISSQRSSSPNIDKAYLFLIRTWERQ